ncbi:KPN_02809 family neutral zinc metallopeptidase [Reyranella sp.]|uniref:KPN_02809 family neutral zinc metallopeptidase n=1 Tax=Reyranella sp. TaxID=1929291 RepID=UPI003D146347
MQMDGDESSNIEDRRGEGGGFGGGGFGGGGFGGVPMGGGLFKGGFGLIAVVVIGMILGVNPLSLLGGMDDGTSRVAPQSQTRPASRPSATADPETQFVARVLKSTEDVWGELFQQMGRQYRQPRLVLFRDATQTACGTGQSAMGPFYCPPDQRVYIDLSFFDELASRFRAPGQFPQAYVIAHEIGHHVQNLLGISGKVQQMQQSMSKRDANAMSVRVELQADCFAGVWAYHANRERGGTATITDKDVDQALAAATAIGDDRLQRQSQGRVVPDSFTHGSSAQRVRWFRKGLESGDLRRCDTFRAQQL